jgi:hypothetical protein
MGPYCPLLLSFFFPLDCHIGSIHLFEKKIDDAQTQIFGSCVMHNFYFGCIMDTSTWHNMLPYMSITSSKQCIIIKAKKKLCLGSTKICWASGQLWEKKERETNCTLVLSAKKDPIRNSEQQKLRPHGSTNSSPIITWFLALVFEAIEDWSKFTRQFVLMGARITLNLRYPSFVVI